MKRTAWIIFLCGLAAAPAGATVYDFSPDVSANLPGAGVELPWTVVTHDTASASYQTWFSFPARTPVAGLHRMAGGDWLLTVKWATTLGGTAWLPQDVVRYNPGSGTYSCFFRGSAVGVPLGSGIDALYLSGGDAGPLVVSFNAPTTIGGAVYDRADLVTYTPTGPACTGWALGSLAFDASAAGIPPSVNVTAADSLSGGPVLAFDVATTIAGTTYLPGDLVTFNTGSSTFSLLYRDPSWPRGARLNDLSIESAGSGAVGTVPDGRGGTTPLRVARAVGNLTLTWGASCGASDTDDEVYEGTLTRPWVYDYAPRVCTTGGALTVTFAAPAGSTYYLVVARNSANEGSYGKSSSGVERPQAASACLPRVLPAACP